MRRELIYNILKFAISSDEANFCVFEGVSSEEWHWAFSVLIQHGLAGFAFTLIEKMPDAVRPTKEVVLKFISAEMAGKKSYARLKGIVGKIEDVMRDADVKCLLLKGLSLAEYYPRPESRKFLDVDLYAPGAEVMVDAALAAKGCEVNTDFYRHSHTTIGGILVENHHCLLDVRGRKRLAVLDADLKAMAMQYLASFDSPGLYYPDTRFSLLFNLHHAMSHFIYEGISFKFLVDWIYFLRQEKELLKSDCIANDFTRHGLLKFAAVMSEVSVRYLGLASTDIPECIRTEMTGLKPKVVERFIDDLFRPYEVIHQKNIVLERLHSVRRIIKASWKPKEFLGQSAFVFVWDKFVPILMGKKFEAD